MTQPLPTPSYFSTGSMIQLRNTWAPVASYIATVRANRQLLPLVCPPNFPTFPILIGQEHVRREQAPPRLVLVPTHFTIEAAIKMGQQPMKGLVSQANPRPFGVASCGSRRASGAIRTRRVRTRFSTSTHRPRFIVSCSAECTRALGASRTSGASTHAGSNRPTTIALDVCSSLKSHSVQTSLPSLGSRSPSRLRPQPAFRSTRLSRRYLPMGLSPRRLASSSFHPREAT
jgi:hypothetical protein